jgi:hypothetical protein
VRVIIELTRQEKYADPTLAMTLDKSLKKMEPALPALTTLTLTLL